MNWNKIKYLIPNLITSLRIVGTISLWFVKPFGVSFFVIYTLSGLSDGIDGTIARAMGATSEFGAKLDSISDILYYLTMSIMVFSVLWPLLPIWLWCCALAVVSVRICSYTLAAVKFHRFATLHTYMNKLTGFVFFVLPYSIAFHCQYELCLVLFVVSSISTVEELLIHIKRDTYRSNIKGIWAKEQN